MRKVINVSLPLQPYLLYQAEVDLNLGIKPEITGLFSSHVWKQENANNQTGGAQVATPDVLYSESEPLEMFANFTTYTDNSGFLSDSQNTLVKWKTAVVAYGISYIGNVEYYDRYGTIKYGPSTILASIPGEYD